MLNNLQKIYLKIMLKELDDFYLNVKLTKASEPMFLNHKIRSVENKNPEWYQELCSKYPRNRRNRNEKYTDSYINRKRVINCLKRLIQGKFSNYKYKDDLIEIAKERIKEDTNNEILENTYNEECPF